MSSDLETQTETLLTNEEAKELTFQIQEAVDTLWDLVAKAWVGRADLALGYASWSVYCDTEFKTKLRIPRSEREQIIRSMQGLGMSTRAIASATGLGQGTIGRTVVAPVPSDTDATSVPFGTPTTPVPVDTEVQSLPEPSEVITPDTKDLDRWGRGVTANIRTTDFIEAVLHSADRLQDLPTQNLHLVAKEGDLERWKAQLKEAATYINKCLSNL